MNRSFLSLGLVVTALMLPLGLIRNSSEKHSFFMNIAIRCAVFIIIGIIILQINA